MQRKENLQIRAAKRRERKALATWGIATVVVATLSGPSQAQLSVATGASTPISTSESKAPEHQPGATFNAARGGESLVGTVKRVPRPLPAILDLSDGQRAALDRLYDEFAQRRIEQEGKIARWRDDLQKAQSPTSFDERKAAGLLQSISEAGQKITDAFLRVRGKALEVLTPAQRAQLQELAARAMSTRQDMALAPPARDHYYQLLLLPVEALLQTPVDTQAVLRLAAEKADRNAASYTDPAYYYGYGRGNSLSIFGGFGRGSFFGFGFGTGRDCRGYSGRHR
jgi:Spy/CpxP family protein refolding chaperone